MDRKRTDENSDYLPKAGNPMNETVCYKISGTVYEVEQGELTTKVKGWREPVTTYEQDKADFQSFAAIVRKYAGITELTPTIVNEFVKKIIVHKTSGHRRQKIQLVWNFIGEVNLPNDDQPVERERKSKTA